MRPALRLAARLLYPQAWRERYGLEFDALIDDAPANCTNLIDVVTGGIAMRLRMSHPAAVPLMLALVGALIAGVSAFAVPAKFEARGTMVVTPGAAGDTGRLPAIFTAAVTRAGDVSPANIFVTHTDNDGLQVAYADADPQRARDVVQRVMGLVVEENLRLAEAGSPGLLVKVQAPPVLPHTSSRPLLAWLTAGAFAGAVAGAMVVALRRRVS